MKKVLLTAMAILTLASTSVFGMYGKGDSWIDFLVHGNQFRARMDQLGFVLGNGTIKGTFGFRANSGYMGSIISHQESVTNQPKERLDATVSAGIAYTSSAFGIGLGYNYTFVDNYLSIHTPVLMINALDNNLRISAPIQVAVTDRYQGGNNKYTGVAFDNIQLRYYTGVDAFNALRFYAYYRNTSEKDSAVSANDKVSEALGFQLRLYFLNTMVGNANVNPYLRLEYHTVLKGGLDALGEYSADDHVGTILVEEKQSDNFKVSPFKVAVKPALALSAKTDAIEILFEPSLGYEVLSYQGKNDKNMTSHHTLAWGAYTELYFRPVQDLEWYFEMDVNGNYGKSILEDIDVKVAGLNPVKFETTTGLTWYLPSFGGDAAAAQ